MGNNSFEDQFIELFSGISELYDKDPSPFVIDLWFKAFSGYELEAISKAFSVHIKTPESGKFMPKPADIIKILEGSSGDIAYIAWTCVEKSMSSVGANQSVIFDDPIVHRVIQDMGGWVKLCECLEKDMPFRSKEFRNRYQSFKSSGEIPYHPKRLFGREECQNRVNGFLDNVSMPVLITVDAGKTKKINRPMIENNGNNSQNTIPASNLKAIMNKKMED